MSTSEDRDDRISRIGWNAAIDRACEEIEMREGPVEVHHWISNLRVGLPAEEPEASAHSLGEERRVEERLVVTDMHAFHKEGRLGQVLRRAINFIEGRECFPLYTKARIDPNGTAKPKTEIREVFNVVVHEDELGPEASPDVMAERAAAARRKLARVRAGEPIEVPPNGAAPKASPANLATAWNIMLTRIACDVPNHLKSERFYEAINDMARFVTDYERESTERARSYLGWKFLARTIAAFARVYLDAEDNAFAASGCADRDEAAEFVANDADVVRLRAELAIKISEVQEAIREHVDPVPRSNEARCFHVEAGKHCTRYLEGADGERAAIVKWLRWEADHRPSPTDQRLRDAADVIEAGKHTRPEAQRTANPSRSCRACDQYRTDVGELPDALPLCLQCAKAWRMGYRCAEDAASLDGEDELAPLRARMEKGRAKYPNGCTVTSLQDEVGEVVHAINKYESEERVRDELLDVAGVAMRLYLGEIDRGLTIDGLVQRRTDGATP